MSAAPPSNSNSNSNSNSSSSSTNSSQRGASPWVRKSSVPQPAQTSLFPAPPEGLGTGADPPVDQGPPMPHTPSVSSNPFTPAPTPAPTSTSTSHQQRDRAEGDAEGEGDSVCGGGDCEALPDSRTLLGEVVSVLQHTRKIMQKTVNMLKNLSKKPDIDPDTVWVLETAVEMLISHRPPITASLNRLKIRLTAPDSHPVLGPKPIPYPLATATSTSTATATPQQQQQQQHITTLAESAPTNTSPHHPIGALAFSPKSDEETPIQHSIPAGISKVASYLPTSQPNFSHQRNAQAPIQKHNPTQLNQHRTSNTSRQHPANPNVPHKSQSGGYTSPSLKSVAIYQHHAGQSMLQSTNASSNHQINPSSSLQQRYTSHHKVAASNSSKGMPKSTDSNTNATNPTRMNGDEFSQGLSHMNPLIHQNISHLTPNMSWSLKQSNTHTSSGVVDKKSSTVEQKQPHQAHPQRQIMMQLQHGEVYMVHDAGNVQARQMNPSESSNMGVYPNSIENRRDDDADDAYPSIPSYVGYDQFDYEINTSGNDQGFQPHLLDTLSSSPSVSYHHQNAAFSPHTNLATQAKFPSQRPALTLGLSHSQTSNYPSQPALRASRSGDPGDGTQIGLLFHIAAQVNRFCARKFGDVVASLVDEKSWINVTRLLIDTCCPNQRVVDLSPATAKIFVDLVATSALPLLGQLNPEEALQLLQIIQAMVTTPQAPFQTRTHNIW